MCAARSGWPSGAGFSFFSPSIAFRTTPFFGPSFAGRSNSTTSTCAFTRCAAICAPITPAPRTAAFFTTKLPTCSLLAKPGLRAPEQRQADVAAHLELLPAVGQPHLAPVDLAVVRVEDAAAVEQVRLVRVLADAGDDRHALHRLVLAVVGALVADRIGLLGQDLLDLPADHAFLLGDADQRLRLLRLVVDVLPEPDRRSGRLRAQRRSGEGQHRGGQQRRADGAQAEADRLHRRALRVRVRSR